MGSEDLEQESKTQLRAVGGHLWEIFLRSEQKVASSLECPLLKPDSGGEESFWKVF